MHVLISFKLSKTFDLTEHQDPIAMCLAALEQSTSIEEFQAQGQYSQTEQLCVKFGIHFVAIRISRSARLIVGILHGNAFVVEHIPTHDYQKTVVENMARMKSYLQAIQTSHFHFASFIKKSAFNPSLNPPPVVMVHQKHAIILNPSQVEASTITPGRGTICIGSAGTGKTLVSINRLQHYIFNGLKTAYLAPTANLANEVDAEFLDNAPEMVRPICFDWDGFLNWLEQQANFDTTQFRHSPNTHFKGRSSLESFEKFCQERSAHTASPNKATFRKLCSHITVNRLYQEFCSVFIQPQWSNTSRAFLTEEHYASLGRFQSFIADESLRRIAYPVFNDYVFYLETHHLYEPRLIAQQLYQALSGHIGGIEPLSEQNQLDALVIDEVQKFHPWQWACMLLVVRELRMGTFFICGDANQMVSDQAPRLIEPILNFLNGHGVIPKIEQLHLNHRNSRAVTRLVRQLNEIEKNICGSQERHTHLTLQANEDAFPGTVQIKRADDVTFQQDVARDANAVILIPSESHRQEALSFWQDKQLFTMDEFQGLSANTILLFGFSSYYSRDLIELTTKLNLTGVPSLDHPKAFSKHKEAEESSLNLRECIQALYTSIARAEQQLLIMTLTEHDELSSLIQLIMQTTPMAQPDIKIEHSTADRWEKQAELYEQKGHLRQAEAIRKSQPSQPQKEGNDGRVVTKEGHFEPALLTIEKTRSLNPKERVKNTELVVQPVFLIPLTTQDETLLDTYSDPFVLIAEIEKCLALTNDYIEHGVAQKMREGLLNQLIQLIQHPMINLDPSFNNAATRMCVCSAFLCLVDNNHKEAIFHLNHAKRKDPNLSELYVGYIHALKLQNPHPNAKLKSDIKKHYLSFANAVEQCSFSFLSIKSDYVRDIYAEVFFLFSSEEFIKEPTFFNLILKQIFQYSFFSEKIIDRLNNLFESGSNPLETEIRDVYMNYFNRFSGEFPESLSRKSHYNMLLFGAISAHSALNYSESDRFISYMEKITSNNPESDFSEALITSSYKIQNALILNEIGLADSFFRNTRVFTTTSLPDPNFYWYPIASGLHLISKYYYRTGSQDENKQAIASIMIYLRRLLPNNQHKHYFLIPALEMWLFDLNETSTMPLLLRDLSNKHMIVECKACILYLITEFHVKEMKNNHGTAEEKNLIKKKLSSALIKLNNMYPELLPLFLFLKYRQHFSNFFARENPEVLSIDYAERHAKNPDTRLTLFYDAMDFLALRKPSETAEAIQQLKHMNADPILYQSIEIGLKALHQARLLLTHAATETQGNVHPSPLANATKTMSPLSASALSQPS